MAKDPSADNPAVTTALNLAAYRRGLPRIMAATNAQILPTEQARLQAAQAVTPGYTNIINDAARAGAIAQGQTEADVLASSGVNRAQTAANIDRNIINPESYIAQQAALNGILQQINALDLNNANPEAERLVNQENQRSGNIGTPASGTNSVKNALQFGNERLKRISALDQALNTATNFITSSKASFDPFGRSTTPGSPSFTAPAPNAFDSIGEGIGATGSNLLNNIFGTAAQAQDINANRRSSFEVIGGSLPSYS